MALVTVAAGLGVFALVRVADQGVVQPHVALAFGCLIALGEFARIRLPGDRDLAPVGSAGALAYALLISVGTDPARHPWSQVVVVTVVAVVAGALPHVLLGRFPRPAAMAGRVIIVGIAASIFRPIVDLLPGMQESRWIYLAILVALVVLTGVVEVVLGALPQVNLPRVRFRTALRDEVRARGPLSLAVVASGMLLSLATYAMGLTALAVFVVPLLVTQVAYRRYAGIRRTYLQTIRSLARIPEVGGYVEPGHSRRVSDLAVSVGRELGMGEPDLLDLEYAALMHDIGQLSLREPIPRGATVLAPPPERRRIAGLGAEVIRQAGVLSAVAEIVRRQADAYRDQSGMEDGTLPLACRIVKVVNAYDDLVSTARDSNRRAVAFNRLNLDSAAEYDPRVIHALARIVGDEGAETAATRGRM
jgi:hypothetical protein